MLCCIALREKLRKRRLLLRLSHGYLLLYRFITALGGGLRVGGGGKVASSVHLHKSLLRDEFGLGERVFLRVFFLVALDFKVKINIVTLHIVRGGRDDDRNRAVVAPRHGKQAVEGVLAGALELGVADAVEVCAGLLVPLGEHVIGNLMNNAFVHAGVEFPLLQRDVSDLLVDVGEPDVVVMLGRGTTACQEREQVCGQPARHASVELLQECLLGGCEEVVFDLYSERNIGVPHAHRLVVFLVGVEVAQQDDVLALLDGLGADALDERCLDHVLIRCFKLATGGGMTNDDVDVKR